MKNNGLKYRVNIYWSPEDDSFIAEMPELPGCMSDGKTYEEALKNIVHISEMWIKTAKKYGDPIPKPRAEKKRKISSAINI